MSIVKMNKFTLYFLKEDRDIVLDEFQSFGGLEFRSFEQYVNTNEEDEKTFNILKDFSYVKEDEKSSYDSESLSKLNYCIELLRPYSKKTSLIKTLTDDKYEISYEELKEFVNKTNWEKVYEELKDISSRIAFLDNEFSKCLLQVSSNSYYKNLKGDVSDYKSLKNFHVVFGSISNQLESEIIQKFEKDFKYANLELLDSTQQDSYFSIIIHNDIKQEVLEFLRVKGFVFYNMDFDCSVSEYLDSVEARKDEIQKEKTELVEKLKVYENRYLDLKKIYEYYSSNSLKWTESHKFLESNYIMVCEGYIESENIESLKTILDKKTNSNFHLDIYDIDLEESSDVPIKLSNNSFIAPFEGVVEMYSYPAYREVDPTPVITTFFIVFFGMMLADAGYGILITLASVYLYVKSKTIQKKNSYRMFIFTGISTTIWGILYGAYFGDMIPRYFGVNVPIVLDVNTDIMTIFLIAIAFGFVHLILGLFMKAVVLWKNNKKIDIVYDVVSWLLILGGVVMIALQGVLPMFKTSVSVTAIVVGILILLFTQGREAENIVGKIGGGIYGVYGITGYLGDVISYSRLLALGLASGFIANAFNIMGGLIPFPFNIVITPLMLIPLHIFNLGINALGTYVHSARLQYLEFFGKFYSGGGKKFSPLKYTDTYIRIKK